MSGSFGGQATVIASVNSAQGRSKSSGEIAQQALLYFQYVAAGNKGPRPAAWFLGDSSGPSIFQVLTFATTSCHSPAAVPPEQCCNLCF